MALPSSQMVPRSGVIKPRQGFNQRRFPRTVLAQQRHDPAASQAKINVIQRFTPGKNLLKPSEDFPCCSVVMVFPHPDLSRRGEGTIRASL